MSTPFPIWAAWSIWGVIALSTVLALHAIFWDWLRRARRPEVRRCPRCWYDMSPGGMTCPECGRTAHTERAMHRARRRWSMVIVALVLALSSLWTLYLTRATYRQIARMTPTWLLFRIAGDPCTPPPNSAPLDWYGYVRTELWRRSALGELSSSESRTLATRQLSSTRFTWLNIESRPSWPAGVPLWVGVSAGFAGARARDLIVRSPWAADVVFSDSTIPPNIPRDQLLGNDTLVWWLFQGRDAAPNVLVDLGPPTAGASEFLLDAAVHEGLNEVYSREVRTPIKIVNSIDEAIAPDTSPELSAQVKKFFSRLLLLSPDGHQIAVPCSLTFPLTLTVAVRVEFLRGKDVIAIAPLLVRAPDTDQAEFRLSTLPDPDIESDLPFNIQLDMLYDGSWARLSGPGVPIESTDGLHVRISSDPELALRQFDKAFYWKGEFTFDFVPHPWPDESAPER